MEAAENSYNDIDDDVNAQTRRIMLLEEECFIQVSIHFFGFGRSSKRLKFEHFALLCWSTLTNREKSTILETNLQVFIYL